MQPLSNFGTLSSSWKKPHTHWQAFTFRFPLLEILAAGICPFWTFYISGICVWFLSLSIVFSMFSYILTLYLLNFFLWLNNSPTYGYTTLVCTLTSWRTFEFLLYGYFKSCRYEFSSTSFFVYKCCFFLLGTYLEWHHTIWKLYFYLFRNCQTIF